MPVPRVIPTDAELRRLIRAGKTHQDIADMVYETTGQRVTRGAVSSAVSRAGLSAPMNRYTEFLPWKVKIEHSKHYAARMLRLLGRVTSGEPVNEKDAARLEAWKTKLQEENAVVAYVPETDEGFFYVSKPDNHQEEAPIISRAIKLDELV